MKNKRGITLIALVITIIILLLLAGITITQLKNNGLFENAKLAKKKSDDAQDLENLILSDYENKIDEYFNSSRDDKQLVSMNLLQEIHFSGSAQERTLTYTFEEYTNNAIVVYAASRTESNSAKNTGYPTITLTEGIVTKIHEDYQGAWSGCNSALYLLSEIPKGSTITVYRSAYPNAFHMYLYSL